MWCIVHHSRKFRVQLIIAHFTRDIYTTKELLELLQFSICGVYVLLRSHMVYLNI